MASLPGREWAFNVPRPLTSVPRDHDKYVPYLPTSKQIACDETDHPDSLYGHRFVHHSGARFSTARN